MNATLEAFTVLLQTGTLLAVAPFPVAGRPLANFRFERIRITLHRDGDGLASEWLFGE